MPSSRERKAPEGNNKRRGDQASRREEHTARPARQEERSRRGLKPISGIVVLAPGKPADLIAAAEQFENLWSTKGMGKTAHWITDEKLA